LRAWQGNRDVAIERLPGFKVDLGFEGGLEALLGVVLAKEVGLPHKEALAVVVAYLGATPEIKDPACC
jgi:hypothetical protein